MSIWLSLLSSSIWKFWNQMHDFCKKTLLSILNHVLNIFFFIHKRWSMCWGICYKSLYSDLWAISHMYTHIFFSLSSSFSRSFSMRFWVAFFPLFFFSFHSLLPLVIIMAKYKNKRQIKRNCFSDDRIASYEFAVMHTFDTAWNVGLLRRVLLSSYNWLNKRPPIQPI